MQSEFNPDLEAFRRWLEGNTIAYTYIYSRHSDYFRRIVFVLVQNGDEEVYQKTWNGKFKKSVVFEARPRKVEKKKRKRGLFG